MNEPAIYAKCHLCCSEYIVKAFFTGLHGERIPIVICPTCKRTEYQERLES